MEPAQIARGRAVWMLAAGQTLGYACLYYIFAALILSWQADLGWDKAALALGPTIAIVLSAGLAPVFGRLVDRGYGPEMLGRRSRIGRSGAALAVAGHNTGGLSCRLGCDWRGAGGLPL